MHKMSSYKFYNKKIKAVFIDIVAIDFAWCHEINYSSTHKYVCYVHLVKANSVGVCSVQLQRERRKGLSDLMPLINWNFVANFVHGRHKKIAVKPAHKAVQN